MQLVQKSFFAAAGTNEQLTLEQTLHIKQDQCL